MSGPERLRPFPCADSLLQSDSMTGDGSGGAPTRMTQPARPRQAMIDLLKAVSCQMIVWHHLAFYGPMSDVVHPQARWLIDNLYRYGRAAVYVFLVVAGYLAAASLMPAPGRTGALFRRLPPARIAFDRYLRLARPYWVAILIAILFAAIARQLFDHPATPAAPSAGQILAHALLLHDLLGFEALSAGVWYVAIDLQLYATLLLIVWLADRHGPGGGPGASTLPIVLCLGLMTAAWLGFGRDDRYDAWGVYFFGAYGLGIVARWGTAPDARRRWLPVFAALAVVALAADPRARTVVALAAAALLMTGRAPGWADARIVRLGSRISYAVFLVHYPVCLLVNAVVFRFWGSDLTANATGLVVAWLLGNAAGWILYRVLEVGAAGRGESPGKGAGSAAPPITGT